MTRLTLLPNTLRDAIEWRLNYLVLYGSLFPGMITNREVKAGMSETAEWLRSANDMEVMNQGPRLISMFRSLENEFRERLPHIAEAETIGRDFTVFMRSSGDLWSDEIPYGWLAERFQCGRFGIPDDMPYQARVGLAHHAGFVAVVEGFLVNDAFSLLLMAERAVSTLEKARARFPNVELSYEQKETFGAASALGVSYSRLAVISFYAFMECFVNSVGADFIAKHGDLPPASAEVLRGREKGRWLPIERKLAKFPTLICGDKQRLTEGTCPKPEDRTVALFLSEVKPIRDASVHYGTGKARIWLKPNEWLQTAERASIITLDLARGFWNACYPGRGGPKYLWNLDGERFREMGQMRIEAVGALADESGRVG